VVPQVPGQNQPAADPAAAAAAVVPADPTPNKAASPTGRVNNQMYDVIHFDIEMVVEADQVPWVLDQLAKGRLMSVLQVNSVTAVDSAVAKSLGFFYGSRPMVSVRFRAEDLFMRKWSKDLMPPQIRKQLGVPDDQPAAAATPGQPT